MEGRKERGREGRMERERKRNLLVNLKLIKINLILYLFKK